MIDLKSTLKVVSLSLILFFIIGYSLFEFRWVIQGPKISVETPKNGESFDKNLISVRGKIENVTYLALNDYQITVDPSGVFEEKLLLSPGFNIMKLETKDRFGRTEVEFLEVLYTKNI